MNKVVLVLLGAVGLAYYFGYDISDFLPSLPTSNSRPASVRHAARPVEQTPNATPAPTAAANNAIVNAPADGSLASRWQSAPSPKKP